MTHNNAKPLVYGTKFSFNEPRRASKNAASWLLRRPVNSDTEHFRFQGPFTTEWRYRERRNLNLAIARWNLANRDRRIANIEIARLI